jgi:hypothetical protein
VRRAYIRRREENAMTKLTIGVGEDFPVEEKAGEAREGRRRCGHHDRHHHHHGHELRARWHRWWHARFRPEDRNKNGDQA